MSSILTGLALPKYAEYEGKAIYKDTTSIHYVPPLPLFVGHEFDRQVGVVLDFVERPDGLHYVARIDEDVEQLLVETEGWGVSIGGFYDEQADILFIYELSLTPSPVFRQTNVSVVAGKHTLIRQKITHTNMTTKQVKAQEEALIAELNALAERVAALEADKAQMAAQMEALVSRVEALEGAMAQITQQANEAAANVEASLKQFDTQLRDLLLNHLLPTLSKTLKTA